MNPRPYFLVASALALGLSTPAFAQTWDGGGANDGWATVANWNPNVAPISGVNTAITFAGGLRLTPGQNLAAPFQLHSLTFASNAGAFTLSGNPLDFRTGTATLEQNSASAITINLDFILTTNLRISGPGTGSLALPKTIQGPGTLILAGASVGGSTLQISLGGDNNLPGGVFLGDNTLPGAVDVAVNHDRAFGVETVLVHAGNTLRAPTGNRAIAARLQLNFGGNASLPDRLTIASGSNFSFESGVEFDSGEKTLEISNPLTTFKPPLSGTGLIHKTGPGILALGGHAGDNPNLGATLAADAGTLRALTPTGLAASGVQLGAGVFDFPGLTDLVLGGLAGTGNFALPSGSLTLGRNSGPNLTFSGTFSGLGALIKTGASTQTVSSTGASQVSVLRVNQGTFTLAQAGTFTLATTAASGVTVGTSTTVGSLIVSAGHILDTRTSPSTDVLNGSLTVTGTNSRLRAGAQILIGRSDSTGGASPSLQVSSGGLAETGTLVVGGALANSSVTFLSGSLNASSVTIGAASTTMFGSGTANLQGGTWTVGNAISLGGTSGVIGRTGTLSIRSGSTVQAGAGIDFHNSTSSLEILQSSVTAAALQTFNGATPLTTLEDPSGGYALTVGGTNLSMNYEGRFAGTGTLRKLGTGSLTLSNPGSTGGRIRMEGGSLVLGHPQAFQGLVVEVVVDDPFDLQTNPNMVLGGLAGSGYLNLTDVNLTVGGLGTNEIFSGTLVGDGTLTKGGPGRLTLTGMNTLTGQITIDGGTLELASNLALPSNARIRLGGGTLAVRMPLTTLGRIESKTNADATGFPAAGTITRSPEAPAFAALQWNVGTGETQTYVGDTSDGANGRLALTKVGPGTLRLGSQNLAHTGLTTVQAGVLELDSSFAGAGPARLAAEVRVQTGAQIRLGSGTGLPGTYISGGTIVPANYPDLNALNTYFRQTPPSLFAATPGNAVGFKFGLGAANRFPSPYDQSPENLQVRWAGKFRAETSGDHIFSLASDDGSVLYIDGNLVINGAFFQGATVRYGIVSLAPGLHDIVIAYFQGGGNFELSAAVQLPGATESVPLTNASLSYVSEAAVGGLSGPGSVDLRSGRLILAPTGYSVFAGSIVDTGTLGEGSIVLDAAGTQVMRGPYPLTGTFSLQRGNLGLGFSVPLIDRSLVVTGQAGLFAEGADRTLGQPLFVNAGAALSFVDDPAGARTLHVPNGYRGTGTIYMQGSGEVRLANGGGFNGVVEVDSGTLSLLFSCSASTFYVTGGKLSLAGTMGTTDSETYIFGPGTLTGSGTVYGKVTNYGTIAPPPGFQVGFRGEVENQGIVRAVGGATINASNATNFVNTGLIDIISGTFLPPAGFVNEGVILDSSVVRVNSTTRVGSTVTLTIDGYTGHTYRLQRSTSLAGGTFTDIGVVQSGTTGQVLTFQDQNASGTSGFYRVAVD